MLLRQLLIKRVNDLPFAVSEDLLAVRQGTRDPSLIDVVALRELRGTNNNALLAGPCTGEENQAAVVGDLLDDVGGAAQVRGCDV